MRVITGSARRLLLKTVEGMDTRPTADRTKGTLFNVLQPQIGDCKFLDLSSGSGAIGIEALSRGAVMAVMIENNPKAIECIRENLERTKLEDRALIMNCDALTGLKRLEGRNYKFDMVFMDSSYDHGHERLVLEYLAHSAMVTEDTVSIIEASRETESDWLKDYGYHMIRSKEYKTNKHVFAGRGEQMKTTVYPGSLNPVTLGHYDIIECTAKMFNKLIIEVLNNKAKSPLFSDTERVNMLKEVTASLPNVEIQSFEGLLIDFVCQSGVDIVVRGPCTITDFEYELQMAQTNWVIAPEIDTIFSTTNLKHSYLSSSIVKGIAEYGGEISEFPRPIIADRVREKLEERCRAQPGEYCLYQDKEKNNMMSRIEQLISEIREYIDNCKFQALSNSKIIVNKEKLGELLVELYLRIPDETKKHQKVISQQDTVLGEAQAQVDAMLEDAEKQADSMVAQVNEQTLEMINEHEIMQRAYTHADEVMQQINYQAQAIVDAAVNDANGIRQSSIQYADGMLRSLQTIINHSMEGAKGCFDAFMASMQSSYDVVSSNRNELSGGIVRQEEQETQQPEQEQNQM